MLRKLDPHSGRDGGDAALVPRRRHAAVLHALDRAVRVHAGQWLPVRRAGGARIFFFADVPEHADGERRGPGAGRKVANFQVPRSVLAVGMPREGTAHRSVWGRSRLPNWRWPVAALAERSRCRGMGASRGAFWHPCLVGPAVDVIYIYVYMVSSVSAWQVLLSKVYYQEVPLTVGEVCCKYCCRCDALL